MPVVAGGTSFMYHLEIGGKLYTGLRLSGETISKIFTGKITNWDDPAITADNNGFKLPATKIIPVVRSDGSGTTAQFTTWMDNQYPSLWRPFCQCTGLTSYYPIKDGMVAKDGSVGVAGHISASYGNGTIGYVEYSYALNDNYPVAKVLNKAGILRPAHGLQRGGGVDPGEDQRGQVVAVVSDPDPDRGLQLPRSADVPVVVVLLHDRADRRG